MKVANTTSSTRKPVLRSIAVAAALGTGVLGLSACSYISPQETTHIRNVTDGITTKVGNLEYSNLLIISTGKGKPGRIIGVLSNKSNTDATVDIAGSNGSSASVMVPANGEAKLDQNSDPAMLSTVAVPPGSLELLKLGDGSGKTEDVKIPVLDATLKEYRPYLPKPMPSSTASTNSTEMSSSSELATPGMTPEPSASTNP